MVCSIPIQSLATVVTERTKLIILMSGEYSILIWIRGITFTHQLSELSMTIGHFGYQCHPLYQIGTQNIWKKRPFIIHTIKVYRRYGDDTKAIAKGIHIQIVTDHLISLDEDIKFTCERKKNGYLIVYVHALKESTRQCDFNLTVYRKQIKHYLYLIIQQNIH